MADRLLARHQFQVPPSLITEEQENMLRDQMDRFRQHGMDTTGMDSARMLEVMKPMAERRVRVRLILGRIAAQENLSVEEARSERGPGPDCGEQPGGRARGEEVL